MYIKRVWVLGLNIFDNNLYELSNKCSHNIYLLKFVLLLSYILNIFFLKLNLTIITLVRSVINTFSFPNSAIFIKHCKLINSLIKSIFKLRAQNT